MRTIDWKWLKANWRLDQQPQTKWRLCRILFPRPFHAYDVIPISFLCFHLKFVFSLFTSSSVFLLLKNLCGSAISWWIGGCLIIHQVLKREIPWVPVYVRVVLLLFTPCQKYNQTSRELSSQAIVLIIYGLFPHSTQNPKLKIHCWYSQSINNTEEIHSLKKCV